MSKKKLARISLLVVVALGATALALALSTGTSKAQGPDGGQGGAGRGGYGPGDGSQGAPPVGYSLGAGDQFGYNVGLGVNPGAGFDNQPMVDAVAGVLGMDSADVFALRQQGLTYADIAAQQGMNLDTLIDRVAEQYQATLQTQLDAGLLNADQVTWMQAEMGENIRARLTSLWEIGPAVGYYTGFYGYNALNQAQMALGMTPDEVIAGLQAGNTLGGMLRQRNMDPTSIIDPLVSQERQRLQGDVDASLMTQAQADAVLNQYQIDLAWRVNNGPNAGFGPDYYGTGVQPVPGVGLPPAAAGELSDMAVAALVAAIQDEYHAHAVYQVVIDQFGPVAPFTRIQAAEAQHIAALEVLFNRYGIPVPAPEPLEDLPQFSSIADACALGAAAEIANFELYDSWIAQTRDYPDLVEVFTSLRNASEFNHLPAFEQCAG
jgi:hypothetical protein